MKNVKEENKAIAAKTKERNIPFRLDEAAVRGLITRIAGERYAACFAFAQIAPLHTGMDRYRISDTDDGKIFIEATGGVAAAAAFRWYLENRCNSYVGPLTRRLALPDTPPKAGEYETESVCLYRYFLNYCTYGYTLAFWKWEQWIDLLDWMMLAGYNLVLNPVGHEAVWLGLLQELGYTRAEAEHFLAAPVFFPWQCMMNLTTWGGAAPAHWYEERVALSRRINAYLQSFGASPMLMGYSGMVPADFKAHFPDSAPLDQGLWCDMPRPAILLPQDPLFARVAGGFYAQQKRLFGGDIHYFSTDPFHEGGDSSTVNLPEYARQCLSYMQGVSEHPVWFLQGWQNNPLREMLRALSPENVLIGNLRSTDRCDGGDNFADYPWLYCCVNNFGGQRVMRGNLNKMLKEAFDVVSGSGYTAVGIGIIPEGIENDELLYDAFADVAFASRPLSPDAWLRERLRIRYGSCPDATLRAFTLLRDGVYVGDTELIPMESALLTRPSLTADRVSSYSTSKFSYDPAVLYRAFGLLMEDFGQIALSEPYRLDLIDIAHQAVDYIAWGYLKGLQAAFTDRDETAFEENAERFLAMYGLVAPLLSCDRHTLFGRWQQLARANGSTPAEKAYFEYLARMIITLWGDRAGAQGLRDYAAREWSGLLEDFYYPRWQSYINILRRSFVTGRPPEDYNRYDAEYFFTTLSKDYPTEPYGDLAAALQAVADAVRQFVGNQA